MLFSFLPSLLEAVLAVITVVRNQSMWFLCKGLFLTLSFSVEWRLANVGQDTAELGSWVLLWTHKMQASSLVPSRGSSSEESSSSKDLGALRLCNELCHARPSRCQSSWTGQWMKQCRLTPFPREGSTRWWAGPEVTRLIFRAGASAAIWGPVPAPVFHLQCRLQAN